MDLLVEVPSLTNRKIVHGIQTIPSKEKHHPTQCQYVLEFFFGTQRWMFLSVVVTNLWGQLDKSQTRLELPKCTMKTPHIDYKVEISIVFTFPTYSRMAIVCIGWFYAFAWIVPAFYYIVWRKFQRCPCSSSASSWIFWL